MRRQPGPPALSSPRQPKPPCQPAPTFGASSGDRPAPVLAWPLAGVQICSHDFQKSQCQVCKQARHAHGMKLWAALISSNPRTGHGVSEAEAVARAMAAGMASAASMAAGQ